MAPSLLKPAGSLSQAEALKLAQQAPEILSKNPRAFSASPLSSLFSTPETADVWTIYENLMLACLRTGDDNAATECLDRIVLRFGDKHDRVLALRGVMKEALASNHTELQAVLDEYESLLAENNTNIPVLKRKVALLKSMGKVPEAITALNSFLDICPTDPEAWAEMADLYVSQGLYQQAIFALEEVLVLSPNAWNVHARLGEISLMAAAANPDSNPQKYHAEALKRFCRSIELCEDYLRGYYGLKIVTDKLLASTQKQQKKQQEQDGFSLPSQATVEKLNQTATTKLGEIVRRNAANEKLWQGYDAAEINAARELLDKSAANVVR